MSRPNTTKLEKPDTENKKNSQDSAISVVDIENGTSSFAGKRLHFIGAGGVGMSGLALLLMKNKAIVTGSDQSDGPVIKKLCQNGADIKIGHKPDNLSDKIDAVIISAAVKEDNPELVLARKR